MRSKVLLLSALLHGVGISCAVAVVHAGRAEAPPAPRLLWLPSRDLPIEPLPAYRYDPVHREDPGPAAVQPDEAPSEPFDAEAFAPPPRSLPLRPPPRQAPPIPDVRIRPAAGEPADERAEEPAERIDAEPETPPIDAVPSEAAYVEAQALESENEPPSYPRRAKLMGWEGEVHVEVRVGADGRAAGVRLAKACRHPVLNREAVRAVGEWRFRPATRGGRPEPAVILVPVEFRLK